MLNFTFRSIPYVLGIIFLTLSISCSKEKESTQEPNVPEVLIYAKTKGFRHECIEGGSIAFQSYFSHRGVNSTFTEDSSLISEENLRSFDVVMFFQTSGNVLDSGQQVVFEKFIRSGKGFVGVHSAADTEYDWPWYGKLVGAYFSNHPDIQSAVLQKADTSHQACKHLPDRWTRKDEWYNFKSPPVGVDVLLTIDEVTYQGGTHGQNHPMSWCHAFDGGRSFYTALGHTVESYKDTLFLEHVLQGVKWAAGLQKK